MVLEWQVNTSYRPYHQSQLVSMQDQDMKPSRQVEHQILFPN